MPRRLLIVFPLLIASCAAAVAQEPAASNVYVIAPLDVVRFAVLGEDETVKSYRVSQDGTVSFPYIGSLKIAGMTLENARQAIYEAYVPDWYVDPQIDLAVTEYAARRVTVLGKVNRQGPITIPPEEPMTLLTAISAAGGWSNDRLAAPWKVKIKRTLEDDTVEEWEVDAREIGPDEHPLQDGDVVVVPERTF